MLELAVQLDRPFHELKDSLLAEFERAYLTRILAEASMNLSMASRTSGLSRKHIRTLMAKHGIRRADHGQLENIDDSALVDDGDSALAI